MDKIESSGIHGISEHKAEKLVKKLLKKKRKDQIVQVKCECGSKAFEFWLDSKGTVHTKCSVCEDKREVGVVLNIAFVSSRDGRSPIL